MNINEERFRDFCMISNPLTYVMLLIWLIVNIVEAILSVVYKEIISDEYRFGQWLQYIQVKRMVKKGLSTEQIIWWTAWYDKNKEIRKDHRFLNTINDLITSEISNK